MAKLKMISLFTGAGGLDYGLEAAGFESKLALEMDGGCCSTLRLNREWPIIEKDIHETSSEEILSIAGLERKETDLLVGGPPCQPFSKSAYWRTGDTARLDDPRAQTLDAYMRCVEDILPKAFLLENVHGISYSGKEEGFKFLERMVTEINKMQDVDYRFSWAVLDAVAYGVPQKRRRFFLVANRMGKSYRFPSPTHWYSEDNNEQTILHAADLLPSLTSWDAIGDISPPEAEDLEMKGKWSDLLPSIPEGENYLWHTNRKGGLPLFGWRTRFWSFLLKLAKNLPSWTIQAQPGPAVGPFHWNNRRLSVEELARLQTFPTRIRFAGGRTSIQKQIGNAVPSLLGEILGRSIIRQIFERQIRVSPKLQIGYNRPIPPPEPVQPVHDKFLHLVGEHQDHPGTGKGPGALNRM
ncbi:MAG: DNA cytosine methyltransferase [Candidatus Thorarchaeota archaeon]